MDVTKDNIGFLLQAPTVTQWNSVYDAVGRLIAIFDNRDNLKACTILTLPFFTNNDFAFFKEYHRLMRPICTALDAVKWRICVHGNSLIHTFYNCKKMREHQTSNNVGVCLPLVRF